MPAIEVKHLVKSFGQFMAVDDISFTVEEGEVFAFLGPNGAGKTTTIKMLTTLLHPTSGEITVNDHPVAQQDEVRRSFGIVFQDASLDDELTAYENMEFHGVFYDIEKSVRKKRVAELLKFVELWDRRDEQVKNFSGGMKRRLEIARGLLHHPKILFLDEPTLGLDPQTRNHMWQYILELAKDENMTVFLTTHYLEEAEKIANRIAIIDHGKIVEIGSTEALKQTTHTNSLEEAFLKITGREIREEKASSVEQLRARRKAWRGR